MTITEIPLTPEAQRFRIALGGVPYNLRITYNEGGDGSWILDLGDEDGAILLAGIPLVSGADLLAQHRHLGIPGRLVLTTDRGAGEVPGYRDLGLTSHLFFLAD